MKQKITLTVIIIAMIVFFIGLYIDNYIMRMITKPIPILAMITLLKPVTNYKKMIFIGLGFSVIGDFLLESSPTMFIFGLVAFLLAQISYIAAFYKRSRSLNPIALIVLTIFGVVLFYLLYSGLGNMTVPVLIYIIIILTMSWRAISQHSFDQFAIYAAAGSLFFVISDCIIAFNKFYVEIPLARWLIMTTYWTAQSMIFYSAYKSVDEE
jgi:uncharacterized membrane protein YhhN